VISISWDWEQEHHLTQELSSQRFRLSSLSISLKPGNHVPLSHACTQSNIVDVSIIKAGSMTMKICAPSVGNQIIMDISTTFVIMFHCILVLFAFCTSNKISTLKHWINSSAWKWNPSDSNRSFSSWWFDQSEVIENVLLNLQNHCQSVCMHACMPACLPEQT
jgi:hypothetical protein